VIPSNLPTFQIICCPSFQPLIIPTNQPSYQPSFLPSIQLNQIPSTCPSNQPKEIPTNQPTILPSKSPSKQPSTNPSKQPFLKPSIQPSVFPSSQFRQAPTHQPSFQPLFIPTFQPSVQPSTQPTFQPTTSIPTSLPTNYPTAYPITSSPSHFKDTNRPERYPTSYPTYDLNGIFRSNIYRNFEKNYSSMSKNPNSLTFGSFYYKGIQVNGSCADWNTFSLEKTNIPIDELYFSAVSAHFDIETFGLQSRKVTKFATCYDAEILRNMVNSFHSEVNFEYYCEGNRWRVYTCEGSHIMCVNCKKRCVTNNQCLGTTAYTINPCQRCSNNNAAFSIINFKYSYLDLSPQFLTSPTIHKVNTTSVYLNAVIDRGGSLYCAAFLPKYELKSVFSIKSYGFSGNTINGKGQIEIIILGLMPATKYIIYCYTDDHNNHLTQLVKVLQQVIVFQTLCCKGFIFTII
jgi:hypothetical protein